MTAHQNLRLWEKLGIDLSPLVPEIYQEYLPVIEDAFTFFLDRLSLKRVAEVLAGQLNLPQDAGMPERLVTLLGQFPTLQKLAQIMARDRRLAPSLRRYLQLLESMEPVTPLSTLRLIIQRELGHRTASRLQFAARTLAEASVAVVVPFSIPEQKAAEPIEGVLKVLKPGIAERLEEEIAIWPALAPYLDGRCAHYRLPSLNYADTLEAVKDLLANEVQLDQEQAHLAAAAKLYAGCKYVQIPSLLPFCTRHITAMERISGTKVTEADHLPDEVRQKLASSIIESLIAQPVWSADFTALFHADPHAGNLFLTEDGRLAILDWSLVGRLGKAERVHTMQIILGALTLDAPRIARALTALARATPNESAVREVVDKAVGTLYWSRPPGFRWLLDLIDAAWVTAGLRLSPDLILFHKSLLTLEGVVADISAHSSIDHVLPRLALRQFSREWNSRPLALPTSRHFGTHLSNLDLLSLYGSLPISAVKFWMNRLSTG